MNRKQLDRIPDRLLRPHTEGCRVLIAWLHDRGWRVSLLELSDERMRRGIVRRAR